MTKQEVLKEFFGHNSFRPRQEEVIDALLANRDVVGVMPTGAGKSICYQIPALLLPGTTLVISPLISLMKDQVSALIQSGVPAGCLNSSMTPEEMSRVFRNVRRGGYKLLYVAPERLAGDGFLELCVSMEIPLVAVDEAHCVSQWGQDFRPSYLNIADFIRSLPHRPVVGAFTATATDHVKEDVIRLLELRSPLTVVTGFDRPNLFFEVEQPKNKSRYLHQFLAERPGQSGIVYCSTRKTVEKVCQELQASGVSVTRYHAGLDADERRKNQEDFVYDRAMVMVATNAFGMGIDKSNVSFVLHYNMPGDLESYYQEAGRAGRDGQPARCTLLFSAGDMRTARYFIDHSGENDRVSEEEREALRQRDLIRLTHMASYCKTTGCLRAAILRYFGEDAPDRCDNCGNCLAKLVESDITVDAQKILSGVARVEQKYRNSLGITAIVRMLHGSRDQRMLELGLDKLSTYGAMRNTDRGKIREEIDFLTREGYLTVTEDEYLVLRLCPSAREVLFQGKRVVMQTKKRRNELDPAVRSIVGRPNTGLYEALRRLRFAISQQEKVPAYVVFSNATLSDMAAKRPHNENELLEVSGVGEVKARRYGDKFLEEIRRWEEENQ